LFDLAAGAVGVAADVFKYFKAAAVRPKAVEVVCGAEKAVVFGCQPGEFIPCPPPYLNGEVVSGLFARVFNFVCFHLIAFLPLFCLFVLKYNSECLIVNQENQNISKYFKMHFFTEAGLLL
jgi:hypothetical protein